MSHRSVPPWATEPITTPIVTYKGETGERVTGLLAGGRDYAAVIITDEGAVTCPTVGRFSLQRVEPWCV